MKPDALVALGVSLLVSGCGGATVSSPSGMGDDGAAAEAGAWLDAEALDGARRESGSGGSSGGSSSGGSSGSSSGGNPIGVDAGGPAPCPTTLPPVGDLGPPCPPQGVVCEYGDDANIGCNEIAACTAVAEDLVLYFWDVTPGMQCAAGTCPASYSAVPQGQHCAPDGLDCAYSQGQCNCAATAPPSGANPVWQCSSPPGCPDPRPRLGAACTPEGLSCDYGACTGGIAEQCTAGYWRKQQILCPM